MKKNNNPIGLEISHPILAVDGTSTGGDYRIMAV
jgi:hypothetical protein